MNTKILSHRAMSVIDQYLHFRVNNAVCSVPYFNNKTVRARAALRVHSGKGSPQDIFDEVQSLLVKEHVDPHSLADESLKKVLTDNNLGIDCSGFAYYILNAESQELGRGPIDKHLSFVNCHGLLGKMRCSLRPIENCDVATLADNSNSTAIPLKEVQPGSIITMLKTADGNEHDHILVVHQVEYQNFVPYKIHYSQAVAYPEDGVYGTGIRQGIIEITDIAKPLTDQLWIENGNAQDANRTFFRAKKSRTEIRTLKWF